MNKVKASVRKEGDCVFLLVQLYEGSPAPNGKTVWTESQHHDINTTYDCTRMLDAFVRDGWLTIDEVAKIQADVAKLQGGAA